MHFEIIGDITDIEPIAVGSAIREVARLRKQYGRGRLAEIERDCAHPLSQWAHTSRRVTLV